MLRIPQSYIDELLEGDWALHDVTTEGMGLKGEYVVTAWPKETGIVAGIEIGPKPIQAFRALEREAQRIDKHMLHSPITIGQPGYGHTRPGLLAQLSFDEAARFSR